VRGGWGATPSSGSLCCRASTKTQPLGLLSSINLSTVLLFEFVTTSVRRTALLASSPTLCRWLISWSLTTLAPSSHLGPLILTSAAVELCENGDRDSDHHQQLREGHLKCKPFFPYPSKPLPPAGLRSCQDSMSQAVSATTMSDTNRGGIFSTYGRRPRPPTKRRKLLSRPNGLYDAVRPMM
jgi:hypothetical protein